jgi:mitochondrial fission protein ELM1
VAFLQHIFCLETSDMAGRSRACTIWCVTDGKLGHVKQVQGLAHALGRHLPVTVVDIQAQPTWHALNGCLTRRYPQGDGHAPPDLIIGAGHATHINMLAAQRAHGGKTVVLMKPTLPRSLFDLCLIPEHDEISQSRNVLTTRGALNPVQPSPAKDASAGLILLGGLSRHYHWQEERIVSAIHGLVTASPRTHWKLTTSPRTPESTVQALRARGLRNLDIAPVQEVSPDWLSKELACAGQVWVTPDSVSMVYEALTSGASVGVFDLRKRSSSRVVRGLEKLVVEGWITRYQHWRPGASLPRLAAKLDEATRCALWIKSNWFPGA